MIKYFYLKGTGDSSMATQYKKIQNKLHPKDDEQAKADLKPKATRDALLLVLIAVTLFILVVGWSTLDDIGHAMYTVLMIGMVVVYLNRRLNLSKQMHTALIAVSSTMLVTSIGLLGYSLYIQFWR